MSIELRQLRYAVTTADAKSFARAAAALNVKQITLSRQVLQLEDRLGVKLFERSTRGAEITENGKPFIEQARRIVTDVDNLKATARNVRYGLHGRIAVGYCSPLMAGNLRFAISDYLTRFPDVQFDGVEAGLEKLFNGVQSRTIDVVVAPVGLAEDGLNYRRVWSERLYAVLPIDHALADNLKRYRAKAGLSQEELAHRADIDRTYVSSLERCQYAATVDVIEKLARELDVEASELLKQR